MKINIAEKMQCINQHWHPKIIAELNGQQVKLAKLKGSFVWHKHEHEDELFYVIKGELSIEFRDKIVHLKSGEMLVVPRNVEHKPVALSEVEVMLFEPASTLNTGNTTNEFTKTKLDKI